MVNPRILIVASSQSIDLSCGTAVWMNELAQPYFAFKDFTDNITLASPNGITISLAGASEAAGLTRCRELSKQEDIALAWIATSVPLHSLNSSDFDILYIAGSDNSVSEMEHCMPLTAILEGFVRDEKPFAAIGLGVTALISIFMANGEPYVKGKKLTSYTNREVMQHGLESAMPFSLETRLLAFGAAYSSNANNRCNVVKDGMLVTGQNAASAAMAVLTLRILSMGTITAS
jgi:putative intracellular protease/amidase